MNIDDEIASARERLADVKRETDVIRAAVQSQREALQVHLAEMADLRGSLQATREELARTRAGGAGGKSRAGEKQDTA